MVACYRLAKGWALVNAMREARQFGCAMPDQLAFIEDQATAAGAISGRPDAQPSDDVLAQTTAMNKDPYGLQRALTLAAETPGG